MLNYWNNSPSFLFLTDHNGEADAFPSASAHSQAQTPRFVLKTPPNRCTKQFPQRYPGFSLRFLLSLGVDRIARQSNSTNSTTSPIEPRRWEDSFCLALSRWSTRVVGKERDCTFSRGGLANKTSSYPQTLEITSAHMPELQQKNPHRFQNGNKRKLVKPMSKTLTVRLEARLSEPCITTYRCSEQTPSGLHSRLLWIVVRRRGRQMLNRPNLTPRLLPAGRIQRYHGSVKAKDRRP